MPDSFFTLLLFLFVVLLLALFVVAVVFAGILLLKFLVPVTGFIQRHLGSLFRLLRSRFRKDS